MSTRYALLIALLVGALAAPASACIWDQDTLAMETREFPGALELITGKFLRHSEAFYAWRITDREARIAKESDNLALLDDLAVAYEKTGNTAKAIEIMLAKAARKPDVYETEANLGTFYIHAGEPSKGLEHIRRAIKINPDAHFGREIQQAYLVQYVLSHRKNGELVLPLAPTGSRWRNAPGYADFLARLRAVPSEERPRLSEEDRKAAIKGVLGMMRFGNHDSPVLLEALADMLVHGHRDSAARRLACRAYLKASYETTGDVSAAYRAKAEQALATQTTDSSTHEQLALDAMEATFRKELEAAATWTAEIEANEKRWIAAGDDPEARFAETYYGEAAKAADETASETNTFLRFLPLLALLFLINVVMFVRVRRRNAARAARAQGRRRA